MRRALVTSFGASAIIQAAGVVSGVVLARFLDPAGRGELAAIILWPSILATVGTLGLPEALTVWIARGERSLNEVVGTGIAAAAIQSLALVALGAGIVPLVLADASRPAVITGLAFLAFIPLNILTLTLMGVLNGLNRYRAFHTLRVIVTLLSAGGIAALAVAGRLDVRSAAAVYIAANVCTVVAAAYFARPALRELRVSWSLLCRLVAFGAKSQTSGVSSALNERLDQLVISVFLAPAQLGLYVVATSFTSLTALVGSSVAYVALPTVSRARNAEEQSAAAVRLTLVTFVASTAVSVPMILLVPQLIGWLFGSSYLPATNASRILLGAVVLLSTSRTIGAALKGMGRPLTAGIADGLGLAGSVALLAVLLPFFGLLGAAFASAGAYALTLVWMLRVSRTTFRLSSRHLFVSGWRQASHPVARVER